MTPPDELTPNTLREWAKGLRLRDDFGDGVLADGLDAYASAWAADRKKLNGAREAFFKAAEERDLAMLTLRSIKALVVGERRPENDLANTTTRGHITDLCDAALRGEEER